MSKDGCLSTSLSPSFDSFCIHHLPHPYPFYLYALLHSTVILPLLTGVTDTTPLLSIFCIGHDTINHHAFHPTQSDSNSSTDDNYATGPRKRKQRLHVFSSDEEDQGVNDVSQGSLSPLSDNLGLSDDISNTNNNNNNQQDEYNSLSDIDISNDDDHDDGDGQESFIEVNESTPNANTAAMDSDYLDPDLYCLRRSNRNRRQQSKYTVRVLPPTPLNYPLS